ncbi:hypothetical protein [Halorhabdus sp. CUG00001]|uniref:DUF7094 domain-containing protein n=1 Tax=Halorhabdus sp. CUG00001 TaxID=2600297 RepID=UPI00131B1F97|nr:hypothetical protein [Halorhabdus sp. CUG00001]
MRRRSVLATCGLVALLLVGTVAAVPSPASTGTADFQTVSAENETINRLQLQNGATGSQHTVDADLSSTLASDREQLQSRVASGTFQRQFATAESRSAQIDTVRRAVEQLRTRGQGLRTARIDAVRAYNRGEMTATKLFGTLTRIEAAAHTVRMRADTIDRVTQRHDVSLPPALAVSLARIDAEIVSLTGPLMETVAGATRGNRDPARVVTSTADGGIVLAGIDGSTYVREATRWTARADSGTNEFATNGSSPLVSAHQRAQAVYPWAFDNLVSNPSISGFGDSAIYPVRLSHAHGTLDAYFDGRTTAVFHEVHRLQLSRLPTTTVAANETETLAIEINRTTAEGPAKIVVSTPERTEPVAATLSVEDTTVGTTGADGQLWLARLDGQTVTASTARGNSISVTMG